jgi:serine/threonine protein kinase
MVTLVGLTTDIFSAITFLHSKGIIHRDIKSSNILIFEDEKTKRLTAKISGIYFLFDANITNLLDFGSASGVQTATASHSALIGTWCYMAPGPFSLSIRRISLSISECAAVKPDQKTDMWAAGIVTFELMTLNPKAWSHTNSEPKTSERVTQFLKTVESDDAIRPQFPADWEQRPEPYQKIRDFIVKLWNKIPNQRPSAGEALQFFAELPEDT